MTTKLTYFDGRGLGELIRMILAYEGEEFTDELLSKREEFLVLQKEKLLFGQVPLLEIDGFNLVQSGAIVRHLARKYNLYGSNNTEATLIDMYYEGAKDFNYVFLRMFMFEDEATVLKTAKEKALPRYLPVFEKILADGNGDYLVGSTISLADFQLLEPLLVAEEFLGIEILDAYPKLKEYYERFKSDSKMLAFLNGPLRKKKNDQAYADRCKSITGSE